MSSTEEWNDDAIIFTALGKCLQYIVCICCWVDKKQVTPSRVWFHLYKITHTHIHKYTYIMTMYICTENLSYLYFSALFEFLQWAYILFIIIFKGKKEGLNSVFKITKEI